MTVVPTMARNPAGRALAARLGHPSASLAPRRRDGCAREQRSAVPITCCIVDERSSGMHRRVSTDLVNVASRNLTAMPRRARVCGRQWRPPETPARAAVRAAPGRSRAIRVRGNHIVVGATEAAAAETPRPATCRRPEGCWPPEAGLLRGPNTHQDRSAGTPDSVRRRPCTRHASVSHLHSGVQHSTRRCSTMRPGYRQSYRRHARRRFRSGRWLLPRSAQTAPHDSSHLPMRTRTQPSMATIE